MKTLILNGSTRRQGDTAALTAEMRKYLAGEVLELTCFDGISPCTDCRDCWKAPGCSLDDALRPLYPSSNPATTWCWPRRSGSAS